MNKAYKIKLYPNISQEELLNKTFGCSRFIFNQMLSERIEVYKRYKEDKEKLYSYNYKTEKEYKKEFEFLNEVSSYALQQSRIDLQNSYLNFFKSSKSKRKVGFPKFKSKRNSRQSFRICQTSSNILRIGNNKVKVSKYGWIKFRGLDKKFNGVIKSVTISKDKVGDYFASILVEKKLKIKERVSDNVIGIDYGLKEFITTSENQYLHGIKNHLKEIENKIIKQQKHFSRKIKGSKRRERCKIKLAKLNRYKTNFQNHFFWHLANKLCSENKAMGIEDLNISGMMKNRKLSKAIYKTSWSNFVTKLEQKAKEYDSVVHKINRWFPSSKLCSCCGALKENLTLGNRVYSCDCGLEIDRDLNASINIRNEVIKNLSLEYSDYKRGENVRPVDLIFKSSGNFVEAFRNN